MQLKRFTSPGVGSVLGRVEPQEGGFRCGGEGGPLGDERVSGDQKRESNTGEDKAWSHFLWSKKQDLLLDKNP